MSHRIDVLMPAYNAASTLAVAVESILTQSVPDLVLHIVDDGSTDATGAIADGFAQRDARVRVHRQANAGIVDALNVGLEQCSAPFLARLDSDDIAYPDRLDRQLAFLEANPDVVGVGTAVRHIDVDGHPTGSVGRMRDDAAGDAAHVPAIEPYIIHPTLLARRSAIMAVGGYRYVHHAEDSDLFWRLSEIGRLHNLPEVLCDYRLHTGSVSARSIINGRIMSISSQLAAVSALRRERGVADIEFQKDSLAAYRQATTLAAMVDLAAQPLDDAERRHFEGAVAAKLMELTAYRPYELEPSDCGFIRAVARRGYQALPPSSRSMQKRFISGTAARLAANGRLNDARRMLSPADYPAFFARTMARVALPDRVWRAIRRVGADTIYK